jgi:hypothetical protein
MTRKNLRLVASLFCGLALAALSHGAVHGEKRGEVLSLSSRRDIGAPERPLPTVIHRWLAAVREMLLPPKP